MIRRLQERIDNLLSADWLPEFVVEIVEDRQRLLGLLSACIAIAAAGLDPHVLDPGSPRGQALLLDEPDIDRLLASSAIIQAGLILVGGAIADIWRSERLLQLALVGLVVASVGATLMPAGYGLVASRFLAWASIGIIIPFAVGTVAMLYTGVARATALGLLFGIFGATTAAAPVLATVFGPDGPEIQAFGLVAILALVAAWAVGRWLPDLPGALISQRRLIISTALWAFGVIVITANVVQLQPLPLVTGSVFIAAAVIVRRRGQQDDEEGVDGRRVSAALAAGLVVGFSQAVPMLALPAFFTSVQGIDGFVATFLIAPFVLGLLVAGPLAGWLLQRAPPRILLIGGVWALAGANLVFVITLDPDAAYVTFIVPFAIVGVGFVIANVIRTAVIFASTPRHLPASAAALNESSIGVGARMAAILVIFARQQADAPLAEYDTVFWLRAALLIAVMVAVVGGIVVTLLVGRRDPLRSVYEHRDERMAPADGA